VGAPRPELRALREALVRGWLAGRTLGAPAAVTGEAPGAGAPSSHPAHPVHPAHAVADVHEAASAAALSAPAQSANPPPDGDAAFADDVRAAAAAARDGTFGDRKVFVSAVWGELQHNPRWAALTLDELKARLVAAHRAGQLALARADLVAAMDPALVAASEIVTDGARFHFVVKEAVP
jgi:hypothetical protein